jgi:hypothetical protein
MKLRPPSDIQSDVASNQQKQTVFKRSIRNPLLKISVPRMIAFLSRPGVIGDQVGWHLTQYLPGQR